MEILRNKNLATRFQILVEVAHSGPNVQQRGIAARVGISPQAVSDYVGQLLAEGLLVSDGRSRYRVTSEGTDWILKVLREIHDYNRFIEEAVALGVINGCDDGCFWPNANVTRAQIALMLARAGGDDLRQPPVNYSSPFLDVPPFAAEAVDVAHYNGLVSGKTADSFSPYSSATRGQVAKMVYGLYQALAR